MIFTKKKPQFYSEEECQLEERNAYGGEKIAAQIDVSQDS